MVSKSCRKKFRAIVFDLHPPRKLKYSPVPEESNPRAGARTGRFQGFGSFFVGFWPRDRSETLRKHVWIHFGRFSRPGDHSGAISDLFGDFGPNPLSETSTSVLSQQQISVLSQQQTSVLSQQQTSVLSQQKTSILSQQKTRRLPASSRLL